MPHMKEKIKTVAVDLFYKKGYFATSMSDIARGSGIRKATIYHHYANKEDLLFDILKMAMADLEQNLAASLEGVDGAEARLRAAVNSHVRFHIERQKEVLISDSELRGLTAENYRSVIRRRNAYERQFQQILEQGLAEGVFAAGEAKVISYAILTMCTAVAIWFRPAGRLTKDEIALIYEDFVLQGLKGGRIGQ